MILTYVVSMLKVGVIVDKLLSQLKNVTDLQERMFKMEKRMDEVTEDLLPHVS